MTLLQQKHDLVNDRFQLLVIAPSGKLLQSCDTLMDLSDALNEDLFEVFDFLDPLREIITGLKPGDDPFPIPIVNFEYKDKQYLLNFEFHPGPAGQILLLLSDSPEIHHKLQNIQQERNESVILTEEIKKQQVQLGQYTSLLEEANQNLDRFAYIVSHDLRSPLRGIANLSEWIGEDIESQNFDEVQANLNLLKSRVKRMEDMIEGILKYSRVGREALHAEELDLDALTKEILDSFGAPKNVSLALKGNVGKFMGPKICYYQIFSNLIQNAIVHSNTDEIKITVGGEDLGDSLTFYVEDNGPGIEPEHHELVFEIFHTLQSKDKLNTTGIGLTIVQKLVNQMGGSISVDSKKGEGAKIVFTVPQKPG